MTDVADKVFADLLARAEKSEAEVLALADHDMENAQIRKASAAFVEAQEREALKAENDYLATSLANMSPSVETRSALMQLCQDQGELTTGQRVDDLVNGWGAVVSAFEAEKKMRKLAEAEVAAHVVMAERYAVNERMLLGERAKLRAELGEAERKVDDHRRQRDALVDDNKAVLERADFLHGQLQKANRESREYAQARTADIAELRTEAERLAPYAIARCRCITSQLTD